MPNTQSINALRQEIWQKELYADVIDKLYFTENKMMGKDDNNIVQLKDELQKKRGDTITVGLTAKLSGAGVTGDSELEGNEEAISAYSDAISIDQWRTAVRLTGKLDEQKNAYDMRSDAKNKLSIRLQEYIERQVFLKLAGVNNTSLTDVNGVTVGARATWSNSPDRVPNADTASGSGDRYLCANSSGADSLSTSDIITPALIQRAAIKARLASPKIKPLRIEGKDYYVMFIHPWQMYDLRQDSTMSAALKDAWWRGKNNPLFTNASLVWNQVIIHEHEYVPYLDISEAGNNFYSSSSGTDFSADCFRALLCGQQAIALAKCKYDQGWVEEKFDYGNKTGFATGLLGGIQKITFNSKDYGVIAVDTYATNLA